MVATRATLGLIIISAKVTIFAPAGWRDRATAGAFVSPSRQFISIPADI